MLIAPWRRLRRTIRTPHRQDPDQGRDAGCHSPPRRSGSHLSGGDGNLFSYGVAIRPIVVGHVLVDDYDRQRFVRVLLVEIAALPGYWRPACESNPGVTIRRHGRIGLRFVLDRFRFANFDGHGPVRGGVRAAVSCSPVQQTRLRAICRVRSSSCLKNSWYLHSKCIFERVRTPLGWNPASTRSKWSTVRSASPAPTSRITESASCVATSAPRVFELSRLEEGWHCRLPS